MGAEPVVKQNSSRSFRGCFIFAGRVLFVLLASVVLLALLAAIYHSARTAVELRAYPTPGKLVDIGGYRLYIHCQGTGEPTVVFESGLGSGGTIWSLVQQEVARFTRACTYDRAGMGWSDPGPQPRDSQAVARELKQLLEQAGVPGPYLLVGNSFGGLYARAFAAAYPEAVVGMVLVDSSHEEMMQRFPPDAAAAMNRGQDIFFGGCRFFYPFGVGRLLGRPVPGSPLEIETMFSTHTKTCRAMAAEYASFDATMAQVRALGDLGSLPLIILSRDPEMGSAGGRLPGVTLENMQEMDEVWHQLQREMAGLSTNSVQRVVAGSGHLIQVDQPQAVIEAVRDLLE